MEQIQKKILKSELLRSNLRFLVSNPQVFFKMAPCVRGLKDSNSSLKNKYLIMVLQIKNCKIQLNLVKLCEIQTLTTLQT
jgi:hypothetical protein